MSTEKPRAKPGMTCPLWKRDMSKVCHTCEWWTQLRGTNPQGGEIDEWGCAIKWLPILMIENAQQSRQAGASMDKVATEIRYFHGNMVKQNAELLEASDGVIPPNTARIVGKLY